MAQIIIHKDGVYNIYGTIADGPYFSEGCTLEQLKNWTKENHGQQGLYALGPRLERAHNKGTSAHLDMSLEGTILCNRAGENEKCLSTAEFIKRFLSPAGDGS
jgi:hypothetical protein